MATTNLDGLILDLELTDTTGKSWNIGDLARHQNVVLVLLRGLW